jgi:hypothetical protein
MFDQTLFDRLFSRVSVLETGCHVWQGQTDGKSDPYGRTTYKGQTIAAHIAMWKACKGRIRRGFQIDHRCTNRLCINIDHLQEVTGLKNARLREKRKHHKHDIYRCLAIK